ncbi:tetratricopeptide repeat protein [Marinibactrum halimedae]|uniref:Tetratricopeptide repeat protein n=1 Tax=Marinibactrum halimedae TaxID=1444977 RepID=A0AA37WLC1_9GAMM|nr:tetratricopeptide repeat protein [Marinibactrum halimedae]MCD9457432.1 tetratricopeptide repeat protein [Marinibactrum halimedae]GLS25518.1 hypothetical protein GCM10007877_12320 [Marinibactrum halimedae]
MKFDNMKLFKVFSVMGLALVMTACGGKVKPPEVVLTLDDEKKAVELNTEKYIPVRTYDEETGALLPYIAAINPYSEIKGRIKADYVSQYVRARDLFRKSAFNEAHKTLDNLIEVAPKLSGPLVLKGDVYVQQSKLKSAIDSYFQAIAVNENNVNGYLKLAIAQRKHGDFVRSQNTYAKALSIWPDFPEAHLNLSVLYDVYLNKPLKAQRHLEAYQFLSQGKDKRTAQWLSELQERTGEPVELKIEPVKAISISNP